MRISKNIVPTAKATKTQGIVNNQNITYNQPNISYNESGYTYGGVYSYSDFIPTINFSKNISPRTSIGKTQAYLENQSITYNESGVSYNDSRYLYGGIYGFEDTIPIISLAQTPLPSIIGIADIYTPGLPSQSNGISLGPGFFLYITA